MPKIIVRKKKKTKKTNPQQNNAETTGSSFTPPHDRRSSSSSNDDDNADDSDAAVDAAVSHLQRRGVDPLIARCERRCCCHRERQTLRQLPGRVRAVLERTRRCWTVQRRQLRALRAGLECFRTQCLPQLAAELSRLQEASNSSNSSDSKQQQQRQQAAIALVQHAFQLLVRLHDGYILTVSGECRHAADVERARRQPAAFRSRLNQAVDSDDSDNSDNEQQEPPLIYSAANTYSGASWDEWMDDRRGLRRRLLRLLARLQPPSSSNSNNKNNNTLWDDWSEAGRPAFLLEQTVVQEAEAALRDAQQQFTALVQSEFAAAVRRALQSLPGNRNSAVAVRLQWRDKLEQLHVSSRWPGSFRLERYASQFQIAADAEGGGGGALPLQWTTPEHWWEHAVRWPASIATTAITKEEKLHNSNPQPPPVPKRRRVIEESSSDDDDDDDDDKKPKATKAVAPKRKDKENKPTGATTAAAAEQQQTNGMVVKVAVAANPTASKLSTELSVDAIKRQFGVSGAGLSAARDVLEAEEAAATADADRIDDDDDDDPAAALPAEGGGAGTSAQTNSSSSSADGNFWHEIRLAERRVKVHRRALRRALEEGSGDGTDVWNAREVLREALMHAGGWMLALFHHNNNNNVGAAPNEPDPNQKRRDLLRKAIQYFSDAKGLVVAQEKLHALMNHPSDSITEPTNDTRFFRRNLMLLRGQAQVNTGIATVEQAVHCYSECDTERKVQLELAGKQFDAAVASAQAMQRQSTEDAKHGNGSRSSLLSETTLDLFRGQQLESMARRWKATSQWHLYQKPEAVQSFQSAAAVFRAPVAFSIAAADSADEVQDVALECRAECYHAWTTLADLASRSLERGTVERIRDSPPFYDKVLGFVVQALTNAAKASQEMEVELRPLAMKYSEVCQQHGVLAPPELMQSLKDIQDWWQRRKEAASRRIDDESSAKAAAAISALPRSDLWRDGDPPGTEALPPQQFMVHAPTHSRRSKYNLGGTGYSNVGLSSHNDPSEVTPPNNARPPRYRKWCEDEYDEATGQTVAKLVYPCVAPEMPPHIVAILKARREQQQQQ